MFVLIMEQMTLTFRDAIGSCDFLDAAITYYLDMDEVDDAEDDDWDD